MTETAPGWTLVTGATAGIGAAFARRFAAEGRPLVLVARAEERLQSVAAELRERYLVEVEVIVADLALDDGCAVVAARLSDARRPVEFLVNNAGMGLGGRFGETTLAQDERLLDLNVRAVLRLSHAAAHAMRSRGFGQILNVSSVAGYLPSGSGATYAASKAWVTSFTEGLSISLSGTGVQVAVVCPGFTHSELPDRAGVGPSGRRRTMWLQADHIVADALADLRKGKVISVPGRRYKVLVLAARLAPRRLLRRIMARQ